MCVDFLLGYKDDRVSFYLKGRYKVGLRRAFERRKNWFLENFKVVEDVFICYEFF